MSHLDDLDEYEAELELLHVMADAVPVQDARRLNGVVSGEEWWASARDGIVRLVVQDGVVVTVLPRAARAEDAHE